MSFPTTVGGSYGWEKQTTSAQRQVLGAEMAFPDGRKYRYVENGGTAIEEGMLVASEAVEAQHDEDLAVATTAAGSSSVTVTLGSTAAAKNLYAEGYLFFNKPVLSTAGSRVFYKIKSHPQADAAATLALTIDEPDGTVIAVTNGTETAGLIKSPYKDIVVAPAATVGRYVGVSPCQIAANYFGWVQVAGLAVVAMDGTNAMGTLVGSSGTHAGSMIAVGADVTSAVGRVHGKVAVNDEYHTVMLLNLY
jgi:hypothetical protein|tara:strand:+ start:8953 stop:9699 length:747 start_codon:yes stop_codon:yes gene_type:complete